MRMTEDDACGEKRDTAAAAAAAAAPVAAAAAPAAAAVVAAPADAETAATAQPCATGLGFKDLPLKVGITAQRFGDWCESFRYIPAVQERIRQIDSGATVELLTYNHEFLRFFMAPSATREALKTCRPVIALDGTFLIRAQKATLLYANAMDGNQQIIPIAWALVESETKDTWTWFCRLFDKHCSDWKGRDDAAIISDRDKGLIPAVKEVFPEVAHYFCGWHMQQNVKRFGKTSADMLWRLLTARSLDKRGIVVQQSSIGQTISVTGYSGDSKIPPLVSDAPLERKLQQQRVPKQKPVPQKPVTLPQQKPVPTRRPVPAVVKPAAQVQQPAAVQQPAVVQQPAEGQQQGTEGQQSATEKSEAQKISRRSGGPRSVDPGGQEGAG
ncbi:unnamed protein product [Closterium sp. Naga37s-1]|nr:unnamed protein product [Closterium sp. Naga37s-1]